MKSGTVLKLVMQALLFGAAFVAASAGLDWMSGGAIDWAGAVIKAILAFVIFLGFTLWRQRAAAGRE